MNFEDILEILFFLFIGGRFLKNLAGKVFKGKGKDEGPPQADDVEAELAQEAAHHAPDPTLEEDPEEIAEQTMALLDDFAQRASLLSARALRIVAAGAGDEAFEPLRRALTGHVLPSLEELLQVVDQTRDRLRQSVQTVIIDPESLEALNVRLSVAQARILQLETWWSQRDEPLSRQTLGDADALAQALLARIWEFMDARGIEVADARPFCAFDEHGLAFSLMFQGTGFAPLLLPRRFAYDVAAWPILAHEIGHVIVSNVPDLEQEVREALGDQLLVEVWSSEVFADGIGTLLLGPAFVQASARDLASPDSPADVLVAAQDDYGQPTEHPPSHLRIRFMTALLGAMGMRDLAGEIWDEWVALHESPERIILPQGDGSYSGYDVQPFLEGFQSAAVTLTETAFRALSEYRLTSIPGLTFTPRQVQIVEEQAESFRAGLPRRADPRTVVSAAVLVGLEDEAIAPESLAALVKQSILGVGTGEKGRLKEGRPTTTRRPASTSRRDKLVQGLILGEAVLTPPVALRGGGISRTWPSYPRF